MTRMSEESVLVLRTCGSDYSSYGGFKYPQEGLVECPDWEPTPECGHGLHGLLWGQGDWSLLNHSSDAIWQVLEVKKTDIVSIDDRKVKFPKAIVMYSGSLGKAITMVLCHEKAMANAEKSSSGHSSTAASSGHSSSAASSGNCSSAASSGHSSSAASSGHSSKAASSGHSSTAASSGHSSSAASSGHSSSAASSGHSSTAASSGDCSTAASSGEYSTAASSGHCSSAASSGDNGITMAAGSRCLVKAGNNGCFATAYWSEKESRNIIQTALVGVAGIKADTFYCLSETGEWREVRA